MASIGFWTPVRYGTQPTTLPQKAREWVDGYFSLGQRAAFVYENKPAGESAILVPVTTVLWNTILKTTSYTAFSLFPAVNFLFPGLPLIPGMVVVQTAVSCLPIAMLVMKVILRFRYWPHLNQESGFIPPQVKTTLNTLLGRSFDQLPVYKPATGESSPSAANMSHPIMRYQDGSLRPSILIKIKQAGKDAVVLQLYRSYSDRSLEWRQEYASGAIFFTDTPSRSRSDLYISGSFTSAEHGNVLAGEEDNFARLQKLIQEGKGVDKCGTEWMIDDPILPQPKAILDQLLGQPVDRLPIHQIPDGMGRPNIDEMKHPIMRCDAVHPKTGEKVSCIAIKMESLDNSKKRLLILYIPNHIYPLKWGQFGVDAESYPLFFNSDFINADGRAEATQSKNFGRLQTLIQEGKGTDLRLKAWKIIDHQKSKEINT